ncbi:uncharacterized protein PHACADRAFT_200143 [Phanerochaete carnosa HHB-10118-sp]|uniref:F-box domain-containing protein n=1 Tax=Phanerochaete carnosa (strain HHB-10118-sp) TaxID=650164 RepID=K5WM36_PHACS|nr:uncharacterized protein PHACADRAFT_200143 [Phanerochaete carnosa HHB-10118-sp]EKM51322.1 hypothetical protein PHACADRAFT_200143 [Phanerochaete carnosa HHB-10118-sp]
MTVCGLWSHQTLPHVLSPPPELSVASPLNKSTSFKLAFTSRMSPKLPQELWDMVIDHLHDDRATLLVCCCICKSWLPSSRFHLRDHIRLRLPFLRPTAKSLSAEEQDDTDVLARISHPHRACSLTIECASRERSVSHASSRHDVPMHNSLSLAVQALPRLVSLSLIGLRLHYPGHSSGGRRIPYFLQAALQLPHLREIALTGVTLGEHPSVPTNVEISRSLEKLSIRESFVDGSTLSWLYCLLQQTKRTHGTFIPLRHLDIPFISSVNFTITWYTSLLAHSGRELHHLGLQIRSIYGFNGAKRSILDHAGYPALLGALSQCVNLRTLDLFLYDLEQAAAAKAIVEYLAFLPVPLPISEVIISLDMQSVSLRDTSRYGTALRALDTLLCSFGQVRRVTIRQTLAGSAMSTGNPGSLEPVEVRIGCEGAKMLWRNLPELRKRGILRVE